jgi:signal recognition particle subunit SRP54
MFGMGGGLPGGGLPDPSKLPPAGGVSPDALAEAQKQIEKLSGPGGAKLPPGLPGLGKPGLPGLGGGGLPGLGGFNPFRKK